jgi:GAF domain-containing protein
MTRTSGRLAAEVARIATTPASIEDRAAALLEVLRRVVPCDAAWLALRDPERRSHTPLATSGYAEPLREVFRAPDADDEVELLGLNQRRSPMLASELPVPLSESSSWADHLLPAGFRGGIAAGLFTPDDRHLGFLSLLTDDIARPTPRERDVVRRPMGHPPGPTTCTAVRGARPLRKKVVSSQRTTKAKARRSHLLATFNV